MGKIFNLDIYVSAGIGVVALLLGIYFTRRFPFFKRFCIPDSVLGGLIISFFTLFLFSVFKIECRFDETLKDFSMMFFFTSVGFQSDMKAFKKGGKPLVIMIFLITVLIMAQNIISIGIAKILNLIPLFGMATGSIPMSGGHGTSVGFSPLLEKMGLTGASTITMAAATFGLVAGSLLGGPLGEFLVRKNHLFEQSVSSDEVADSEIKGSPENEAEKENLQKYLTAACQLIIVMALGTMLSKLLTLTGITFPTYFGSLIVASIVRNLVEFSPRLSKELSVESIVAIGNINLQLFLGMAMAGLRLWELSTLALPLLIILIAQVAFMAVYAMFVAFPILGKNYDSAILVSGLCGFGLGATPNAMANMLAVCYKYRLTVDPFIIIPILGAMFVDLINTGVVTIFLNFII